MAITSIKRDFVGDPNIVRIETSDALATITTADYWDSQADNVAEVNHGAFTFVDGDTCLINYSNGEGFFTYDSSTDTFVAETDPGSLSETLLSARMFVGSAANVATGVAITGDIGVTNTGVVSITAGSVVNADVNASAAIAYSKLAALSDGNILVGSAANVATSVNPSGDVDISNTGVFSIAPDVIVNADVKTDAAIAFSKLAALPDGEILVGSAGTVATAVAMSGDATIDNTGAVTIANDAVTSAKVDATLLQYAVVSISAAEFNGMYAAPKLLVAAAGANTLITLHRAELLMTYVSAQYAAGAAVAIQYDSTANGLGILASDSQAAADFQDAASTANAFNGGIVKQPFATCVNKGLYLSNITQAFTTGDSTFEMHLWYSVIPTV